MPHIYDKIPDREVLKRREEVARISLRTAAAIGINDASQVAGSLVAPQLPSFRPFRCTDGIDIVPLPIGIPSATLYFTSGINASGQVVGNTLSAPDRAWLYTGGVSVTRLGILGGFDISAAFAVNVLGQVVDNMN